jgi:hypothetical protein
MVTRLTKQNLMILRVRESITLGFHIENEALMVEIAHPGEYAGSRFDWTGFIRQVTLKQGRHTFCAAESLVPGKGTGGIGLCNEFGNDLSVGYDEVAPGGKYPKIGVGLLTRRDSGRYDFITQHPVEPFQVHVEANGDSVTFTSEPLETNGYAVKLVKTISLVGNELTISYVLINTGRKAIITSEYVHNFVALDGYPIGPGYELRFAAPLSLQLEPKETTKAVLNLGEEAVGWSRPVQGTFYAKWHGFGTETPFYWELLHREAGIGIRERGDAPASHIALWGESHVLSPEVFVDVRVRSGSTQQWQRTYTFFSM